MTEKELSTREQLTLEKIKQETARAAAQTESALAEAEDFRSNALKNIAEAEQTKIQTAQDRLDLEEAERKRKEELAANKYHKQYYFTSAVDSKSTQALMDQLTLWSRQEPGCNMEVIFSSPGGSVIDGMAMFDFISDLRNKGHKITTGAIGYAASMAGILLQSGDVRWLGRESYILIHEVSFGAGGKIGEVEDEVKFVKKIQERVIKIFAARCADAGKNGTADKPLSANQLKEKWSRRDWWISSDEAVSWGLIDEVR